MVTPFPVTEVRSEEPSELRCHLLRRGEHQLAAELLLQEVVVGAVVLLEGGAGDDARDDGEPCLAPVQRPARQREVEGGEAFLLVTR